jgi:hypothetical protein
MNHGYCTDGKHLVRTTERVSAVGDESNAILNIENYQNKKMLENHRSVKCA